MTLSEDNYVPESGALFNFGEIGSEELESKLWIKNDEIITLSCGDEFVVIITRSGRAFSYGKNEWGQLGLGDTKTVVNPSCIKSLKLANEKAVLVACGRYHTIITTESHNLFGFGSNSDGQLGLDQNVTFTTVPTLVKSWNFGKVEKLAAGGAFTAAINENGELYVWGSNSEYQLGLGDDSEENVFTPTKVTFFKSPVNFISCGSYHTAAVSQGKLYVWGEAVDEKLGDKFTENQSIPQRILLKIKIKQVSCGHNHTICLSDSGDVYVWGRGDSGQLGLGSHELNSEYPTLLKVPNLLIKSHGDSSDSMEKFIFVSAGESHTIIINANGLALSFGDGRHGKLGNIGGANNYCNFMWPKPIPKLSKDLWIEKAACGGCHTVILARTRKSNEQINSLTNESMMSSTDFDSQFTLSETNSNDMTSSTTRARRNRRHNTKMMETNLPTLTQSLSIHDIDGKENKRRDISNKSSNEVEETISLQQNKPVQSMPNIPVENLDNKSNKNQNDSIKSPELKRNTSFEEKVDLFSKAMDKVYFEENKNKKDVPDAKNDTFSEEENELSDTDEKVASTDKENQPVKVNNPEIAHVGCMSNCKRNQKKVEQNQKTDLNAKKESNVKGNVSQELPANKLEKQVEQNQKTDLNGKEESNVNGNVSQELPAKKSEKQVEQNQKTDLNRKEESNVNGNVSQELPAKKSEKTDLNGKEESNVNGNVSQELPAKKSEESKSCTLL